MLPLPGAWVGSLVEELRYCKKKKKKEREKESENSINDIHYVITAKGGYHI